MSIIRATGNTNDMQRLVMPEGYSGTVTAYLWGGGGGGGGCDSHPGGTGGGAMCAVKTFPVVPGDVIDVAIGAGGGWGGNDGAGQDSHPGYPGTSYNIGNAGGFSWSTRNWTSNHLYRANWPPFLNTYGIYGFGPNRATFAFATAVNFPATDYYTFTGTANGTLQVLVDGVRVLSGTSYLTLYDARVLVSAGNHTITIQVNTGSLNLDAGDYASPAVTIESNTGATQSLSYAGGFGGTAGYTPLSGAGGGGGGATVLFLNNSVIAVAGGGGGGGGGGNHSNGQSAPGDRGQAAGTTAGQNGQNKDGDGGGGGGGGGGFGGGQGGTTPGGDSGAGAGMYGGSIGDLTYAPSGQTPGGSSLSQYRGGSGQGGTNGVRGVRTASSGGNGIAVLVFTPLSLQVNTAGTWTPVNKAFVKGNTGWKEVRNVFVKSNGAWHVVVGSSDDYAPRFTTLTGYYGYNPRPGEGGGGGGGGGGKIICNKLAEMGYFDTAMNTADQQFGIQLRSQDPDAYNGYIRWAQPVVQLLEGGGSSTFRKIVLFWIKDEHQRQQVQSQIVATYLNAIARPWAEEMAYRMQAPGYSASNPAGRFVMNIGLPLCRAIGKLNRGRQLPMWTKTALIWGTTTVLLVSVTAISSAHSVVHKLSNLFNRGKNDR